MPRLLFAAALVFTLMIAGTADAQRWPEGFSRGRGLPRGVFDGAFIALLDLREVQRELDVGKPQQELLGGLKSDLIDQRRAAFSVAGTQQALLEAQQKLASLTKQGDELVELILEPDQIDRLRQLQLQREGARAFEREDLVKELELSEEQVERIREVRRNTRPSGEQIGRGGGDTWRRQVETEIKALLTDEQRAKWEGMLGERFDFPDPRVRGRRFWPQGR